MQWNKKNLIVSFFCLWEMTDLCDWCQVHALLFFPDNCYPLGEASELF